MSGIFAPQLNDSLPVEQPIATGGLQTFAQGFNALLSNTRGSAPSAPSQSSLVGQLVRDLRIVRAESAQRGGTASTTRESLTIQNFLQAGGTMNEATQEAVSIALGKPYEYAGRTADEVAFQASVETPEFQAGYMASFGILPSEATEQERINFAQAQVVRDQAAAVTRANASAGWTRSAEAAYGTAIDSFAETSIGGLALQEANGNSPLTNDDFQSLKLQWEAYQVSALNRPSSVTDAQWAATQDRIENITTLIDSLVEQSSNQAIEARLVRNVADAILGSNDSLMGNVAAATVLNDVTVVANLNAGEMADIFTGSAFVSGANTADDFLYFGTRGEYPPDATSTVVGLSTEESLAALGSMSSLIAHMSTEDRENFVSATSQAALLLQEQDGFLSFNGLTRIFSPSFFANVDRFAASNPVEGETLKSILRTSFSTELQRQVANLRSMEDASNFIFDAESGRLTFDITRARASFAAGDPQKERYLAHFNSVLNERYGGDLTRAAASRYAGLEDPLGFIPAHALLPRNLESVVDRIKSIDMITSNIRRLTPEGQEYAQDLASLTAEVSLFTGTPPQGGTEYITASGTSVFGNSGMAPLIGSTEGASHMTHPEAASHLDAVLSGPFQVAQSLFGQSLVINDAIAKEGTSREGNTPNSRHFHGDAIDIDVSGMNDADRIRLVAALEEAGFQGFGFGTNILHADMGSRRGWAYGNETFGGVPVAQLISDHNAGNTPRPNLSIAQGTSTPASDDDSGAGESTASNFAVASIQASTLPPLNQGQGPAVSVESTPPQAAPSGARAAAQAAAAMDSSTSGTYTQFNTPEEAEEAFQNGSIKAGDVVIINGQAYRTADDGDF